MNEYIVSGLLSLALVLFESAGLWCARLIVGRKDALHKGAMRAAAALAGGAHYTPHLSENAAIYSVFKTIEQNMEVAERECYQRILISIIPGPELCFLSLTAGISLFLALSYANHYFQLAISPLLADKWNPHAFAILLGYLLITGALWFGTMTLKDSITSNLISSRRKPVAYFTIVTLGASTVFGFLLLIMAGR